MLERGAGEYDTVRSTGVEIKEQSKTVKRKGEERREEEEKGGERRC